MEPLWGSKQREGKMFERMECGRCHTQFHFTDSPRVTRIPQCPICGSTGVQSAAA